jgi:hypothetical protein
MKSYPVVFCHLCGLVVTNGDFRHHFMASHPSLLGNQDLVGRTIASVADGDWMKALVLDFEDGLKAAVSISYDECYYEGDSPRLSVRRLPSPDDVEAEVTRFKEWFSVHPTTGSHNFDIWWCNDKIRIVRGKERESLAGTFLT